MSLKSFLIYWFPCHPFFSLNIDWLQNLDHLSCSLDLVIACAVTSVFLHIPCRLEAGSRGWITLGFETFGEMLGDKASFIS